MPGRAVTVTQAAALGRFAGTGDPWSLATRTLGVSKLTEIVSAG